MTGASRALDPFLTGSRRALLVVAVRAEGDAALRGMGAPALPDDAPWWTPIGVTDRVDLVLGGVSKANAGAATALALDPARHRLVMSIGIAGSLPRDDSPALGVGDLIVGDASVFADEGIATPSGYRDLAQMGFAPMPGGGVSAPSDPALVRALAPMAERVGTIATVSTCSGHDSLAREIAQRTGASAEAMEGAAVGLVAMRMGVPFVEVRAISNHTGDREGQGWDIPSALARLTRFCASI